MQIARKNYNLALIAGEYRETEAQINANLDIHRKTQEALAG